jgi:tight adherence protein C
MTLPQIVFFVLTFVLFTAFSYGLMRYLSAPSMTQRLRALKQTGKLANESSASMPAGAGAFDHWLWPLARISLPEEKWEASPLRTHFLNAGYRSFSAPLIFFASKSIGTFLLPGLLSMFIGLGSLDLSGMNLLLCMLMAAALGYYFPNVVLNRLIERRKRELMESFPDALDLMRVCVQAGLGLDAAIARVGDEMRLKSEALYEELHTVSLELRAGASRERAMRNLALRMGLEDVDSLVAMLIQAERFGTSVAESLRVHAEGLRQKRRVRAEEAAAKLPVKMLFPLVFFIFPSLLVILLGPAIISIAKVLLPKISGH